jgi:hypothetical protein
LEGVNDTTSLRLIASPPGNRRAGPWLTGLRPISILAPDGQPLDLEYASRFDHGGLSFDVADAQTGVVLPGRYRVELEGVTVAVPGPWTMSWNLREP